MVKHLVYVVTIMRQSVARKNHIDTTMWSDLEVKSKKKTVKSQNFL